MPSSQALSDQVSAMGYPGGWSEEDLRRNWTEHLKSLVSDSESNLPLKRIQFQMEQHADYQDAMRRWPRMSEAERFRAWRNLVQSSERVVQEVLPACVQCGECCRKSSPTLHMEDLEILRQGKIPWNQIYSIRRSEPVRSPFEEKLFFLLDERIKLHEKEGTQECVLFDNATNRCMVYADRPMQCRAQTCWDPEPAKQLAQQPYLTRRDIFKGVELLLDVIVEHDRRCAFEKLHEAFKRLGESGGENVQEVLEMLAYEDHFRKFIAEQYGIPEDTLDLVFGRSHAELVRAFGFRVLNDPDGTRRLVLDSE